MKKNSFNTEMSNTGLSREEIIRFAKNLKAARKIVEINDFYIDENEKESESKSSEFQCEIVEIKNE